MPTIVLDTNLFVAAGFNPGSTSARIVAAVEDGHLRMIWNEQTRGEIEHVVRRIPPLAGQDLTFLFRSEHRYDGPTDPQRFEHIPDPDDRKFAALAAATGATLVTMDEHLLGSRHVTDISILTPREFVEQYPIE